ncbi:MAG: 8-amino-7-oxononanoate synthase [Bacteroidota bacterium]
MDNFPYRLTRKLQKRETTNELRALETLQGLVDFSSNDYLGLAQEPLIAEAALQLSKVVTINGATGSRLLSGHSALYERLETFLAAFHGYEGATVFNSGYDANLGVLATVPQRGDVVFYDELSHASIRDGLRLSEAKSYKFKHNSLSDLKHKVDRFLRVNVEKDIEIYVVTESVFSMDGDIPELQKLANFCSQHGLRLIIDEAHALGVFGEGLIARLGLQHQVFGQLVTFGKALGCHGAAVLGSKTLKTFLINFSRSLIYTTALPPHTTATIYEAYQFLGNSTGKAAQQRLHALISYFKERVDTIGLTNLFVQRDAAIQVAILGNTTLAKSWSRHLRTQNMDVRAILSPTVPVGSERLRICLHAFNTEQEIDTLLLNLKQLRDG